MSTRDGKLTKLIDANICATHAHQILMAQKAGTPGECWAAGGLTPAELAALVEHQKKALAAPTSVFKLWAGGHRAPSEAPMHIRAILASGLSSAVPTVPVNVLSAWLKQKAPQASVTQVRGLSSLLQMMLDIDRDGGVLQDMYRVYQALKLPVHLGQIGIPAGDLEQCLGYGKELAPQMGACPFPVDAAALQVMCAKMHNWGRRHAGERDKTVLARELMAEDDVRVMVPRIQALGAQKIAVIGHSFTMDVNWSSPSSFVPVVGEIFKALNPKVELRQWQRGGLTPRGAYSEFKFYEEALAWKPNCVLLVMLVTTKEDEAALDAMVRGFTQAGVRVMLFDRLTAEPTEMAATCRGAAACAGAEIVAVGDVLRASPDSGKFVSLDGIHMTEPYHRLMAKLWLKALTA